MATLGTSCGLSSSSDSATPAPNKGKYGAGIDLKEVDKTPIPAQAPVAAAPVRERNAEGSGVHPATERQANVRPGRTIAKKPTDFGSAGSNAYFYLNKRVPKLVLEIDYTGGAKPTKAAVDWLVGRLKANVDKPDGIRVTYEQLPFSRSKWSASDFSTVEKDHRNTHNSFSEASIYILCVTGEGDGTFIGVAYSGAAVGILEQEIRDLEQHPLFTLSAGEIEKAVIVHEVGHLLALVNQTYKSPRNHEDPEHPGHSSNKQSVMYWAIENADAISQVFGGSIPTDYDADDRADLRDLKSGKLS
jgi:hypothetical protein